MLMHNVQLSDPLNEWTKHCKKISSKRNKTDADHEELSKREFKGSLYLDEDGEPCIPDYVLEACIIEGAKKFKLGKQARAGIYVTNHAKLVYDGPKNPDKMYKEGYCLRTSVKVQRNRVIRTRPKIPTGWEAEFTVNIIDDVISENDVSRAIKRAGEVAGVGDWRPKFGLFEIIE